MKILQGAFFILCACIAVFSNYSCTANTEEPDSIKGYTGPEKIYPPDGSTGQSRTPFFNWRPGDIPNTVNQYGIVVKVPGAVVRVVEERLQDTMYVCPDTLEEGTTYEWWVNGETHSGDYITSKRWEFTTGTGYNNPPGRPEIIAPAYEESCSPDVTMQWTCFDPDGDDLTYDVWLGTEQGELDLVSEGQSETEYQAHSLEYGTLYWLQIIAHDAESESVPNNDWCFSVIDSGDYYGVYAELVVHRTQYFSGTELTRVDYISARFDSVYAPDGPVNPLQPSAVLCAQPGAAGGYDLVWQDGWKRYYHDNIYAGYFLGMGVEYYFDINGGDGVPSLVTEPIYYLECRPYITSPEAGSSVTLEGLEVVWANYDLYPDCDRPITIRIKDMGFIEWTDVYITTENDGSYTFSASDVAGIDPMVYHMQIVLIVETRENITATGYDPRSVIETSTWATQLVYRNP